MFRILFLAIIGAIMAIPNKPTGGCGHHPPVTPPMPPPPPDLPPPPGGGNIYAQLQAIIAQLTKLLETLGGGGSNPKQGVEQLDLSKGAGGKTDPGGAAQTAGRWG